MKTTSRKSATGPLKSSMIGSPGTSSRKKMTQASPSTTPSSKSATTSSSSPSTKMPMPLPLKIGAKLLGYDLVELYGKCNYESLFGRQ